MKYRTVLLMNLILFVVVGIIFAIAARADETILPLPEIPLPPLTPEQALKSEALEAEMNLHDYIEEVLDMFVYNVEWDFDGTSGEGVNQANINFMGDLLLKKFGKAESDYGISCARYQSDDGRNKALKLTVIFQSKIDIGPDQIYIWDLIPAKELDEQDI